jgi:chromosome segregation ATPase
MVQTVFTIHFFNFSSDSPDDILNSLETELVQKDTELEMKDTEILSQRKKIERLLLKVCHLSNKLKVKSNHISELKNEIANLNQQLKNKSNHISELKNEIVSLNQKLKGVEGKAAQDHIQMELRQSLNKKFTEVEKMDTVSEIKEQTQWGLNIKEAQTKPLQIYTDLIGLTAIHEQQLQTVTRTEEEDIQSSETHRKRDKGVEGYKLSLADEKTTTDTRSIKKDKTIDCKICSKILASNKSLKQHVNSIHKKMKPHKCVICARTFSQMAHLKYHVNNVHNNLKPF